LLDLEHVRIGPALADVAWWGWVVRHHHPDAWATAWPEFLDAAGVPGDPVTMDGLRALALLRLLEAVAGSTDPTTRARWVDRLEQTAAG
jgi:hypothetical protein